MKSSNKNVIEVGMTVWVREVLRTRLAKKNVKVFGAFRSVFVCQMFVGLLSVQLVGFSVICIFSCCQ